MGRVDRMDQNINYLRTGISGKKCYWNIITWLLDVSLLNAWILHKRSGRSYSLNRFTRAIARHYLCSSRGQGSKRRRFGSAPKDNSIRFDQAGHLIEISTSRGVGKTKFCKSKVQTQWSSSVSSTSKLIMYKMSLNFFYIFL